MKFVQLFCLAGALAGALSADTIIYDKNTEASAGADGVDFAGPLYNSFTADEAGQMSDLQLMLDGDDNSTGDVQVDLYADDSTAPGELISILGSIDDSALSGVPAIYDVTFTAFPILTAQTRYWIGLTGTTTAEWNYDFDSAGIGAAEEFFSNQMGTFSNYNDPYQMSVTETISTAPEPSSGVLFAFGAGLMALARLGRRA